jgi:hypothetical protein
LLCEQIGEEPDPTKMPLELSEFPEEVQVAFFMFSLLPDHYEGMSGTYMGKYWDGIQYFFSLYEIVDPKTVFYIMKMYESIIVAHRADKAEQQRKAEERKAKSGGKSYAHKVTG